MAAISSRLKSRRNLRDLYKSKRSRGQHVQNAPRRGLKSVNTSKLDPTRTITMRKKMAAHVKRQFAILRGRILKLIVDEDAFGLVERKHTLDLNVFCPTGEGGGVDPTCGAGEGGGGTEESKAVETLSKGILAKAKATLDKVPGAKWLREKSKQMYDKLVERYGKKVAIAVVASGQAISWGAFGVGVAIGVPIWVPSAAATVPGAAVAELHYRIKGKGKTTENEEGEEEPDPVLVERLAREFMVELESEWKLVNNAPARRWQFNTTTEQVKAFQKWLRVQFKAVLTSKREEELWRRYIEDGLRKGAGRAFDDVRKPFAKEYAKDESTRDFYQGSKEQFLRDSFRQPVAKETVKLLAGRTFDDLNGVTEAMSTAMSRTLTDALVQGKNPREVARELNAKVSGIGETRSLMIARTELIRAHAEGQLTAMEALGVEDVGVAVEWHTSHIYSVDKKGNPISPCELCIPMEGVVLTIAEARGMIPRHPNCMCSWVPANVGEDQGDQKKSAVEIKAAFKESGVEPFVDIEDSRPESIFNVLARWEELQVVNVFCPTGEGGGVDPTCKSGERPADVLRTGEGVVDADKVFAKGIREGIGPATKLWKSGNTYTLKVPVRYLAATQDIVHAPTVRSTKELTKDPVEVLTEVGGERVYRILDGHHRIARAILAGKKTVEVKVVGEVTATRADNVEQSKP